METAVLNLADAQVRASYFQGRVQRSLQLWQQRIQENATNFAAPQAQHQSLIRALTLALTIDALWPLTYPLLGPIAPYFERSGPWDSWYAILRHAVEQAQAHQAVDQVAALYALLARLQRRRSRFQEAVAFNRRAAQLARIHKAHFTEGQACTNLGYHFIEQGQWWRGEVLCRHALGCFERANSAHGLAHTANHLGLLYTRQQRWPEAQAQLERACTLWEAQNQQMNLVYSLLNLGLLYAEMNAAPESLAYLQQALVLAERLADHILLGKIHNNLACTFRLKPDLAAAEAHALKAKTCFEHVSHIWGLTEVNHNLGLIYRARNRPAKADEYLTVALQNWQRLGNRYGEDRVRAHLAEATSQAKD